MTAPDFTPGDAYSWPLAGTFGRSENESAAFVVVCAAFGVGRWSETYSWDDLERALTTDRLGRRLVTNPFFRPDFRGLEAVGAISLLPDGSGVRLHDAFFRQLRPVAVRNRERMLDALARHHWENEGGPCLPRPA